MNKTIMWHPEDDTTPTPAPREVADMAALLEGRHGPHAHAVAEFLAGVHTQRGDVSRSWAWLGVARAVRLRAQSRTGDRNHAVCGLPRA